MTYPTVLDPLATIAKQDSIQPTNFLNGYKICNPSQLTWSVSLYRVNRTDGQQQTQEDRGPIKDVI